MILNLLTKFIYNILITKTTNSNNYYKWYIINEIWSSAVKQHVKVKCIIF